MSSTGNGDNENEEFLKSYLSQIKNRFGEVPVKPNADADPTLLFTDPESPKVRNIFYTYKQTEAIVNEECAECEYRYLKCKGAPPTVRDWITGCAKLSREFNECKERVREDLKKRTGTEAFVSLDQFSKLEEKK
ncbi:hypothetical protein GGI23_003518 [Coemansia sp. RSA 2559]|nr:hypothetical protein GGI23_003518 [Coemansia sp. RSA 2559]